MNGWALIVFGTFYWLLDASSSIRLQRRSAWLLHPCVIYGMNSLFIFALSGVIAKTLLLIKITQVDGSLLSLKAMLYATLQSLPLEAVNASLLYATVFNSFMFCIAWLMWRQRWFVKV
jgi:predicted acyltransferase